MRARFIYIGCNTTYHLPRYLHAIYYVQRTVDIAATYIHISAPVLLIYGW